MGSWTPFFPTAQEWETRVGPGPTAWLWGRGQGVLISSPVLCGQLWKLHASLDIAPSLALSRTSWLWNKSHDPTLTRQGKAEEGRP